ncbi:hypothetical protein JCM3765_003416 [Sporobolomyces pararoseus]
MSEDGSTATIRFQNDVSTSYLIVWTSILYWDWLATLPCEVRHLWTAKVSPLKVVFLLQRYGSMGLQIVSLALLLSDLPPHVCGKVFWLETLCLNYVLVTADALLSIRVLALYENSRKALACLLVLLASETASLIVAASFVKHNPFYLPVDYLVRRGSLPRMASSLDQARFQTTASKQYLIAWSALLIWDWLATLPVEIEHVWLKKKTPLRITFLLNRYGTLVLNSITMALIVSDVSTGVCRKLFWIERLTLVWVLVLTTAVLSLRVYTIYDRSQIAGICLLLMVVAQLSVLVAAAVYVHPLEILDFIKTYTGSRGCLVADPEGDHAALTLMFFCAPFVTTAVLFIATVFRSWQIQRQQNGLQLPILQKMVRDGALYLLCITVVTSLNAYLFIQSIDAIKSLNLCAVVVVSCTLSCRLVLSILSHKPDSTSGVVVSRVSVSRITISRPPSPSPDECSPLPAAILMSPFVDHFGGLVIEEMLPPSSVKKKKGVTFA